MSLSIVLVKNLKDELIDTFENTGPDGRRAFNAGRGGGGGGGRRDDVFVAGGVSGATDGRP